MGARRAAGRGVRGVAGRRAGPARGRGDGPARWCWSWALMLSGMMLGGMTPARCPAGTTRPSDLRLRVLTLGKRIAGNGQVAR